MDKPEIRRRLEVSREWSLYALADLDDGMFEHCRWLRGRGDSLALVFRALEIRPIFVIGDASETGELLEALRDEPAGYLNLQESQLSSADGLYRYRERHRMLRMFISRHRLRGGSGGVSAKAAEPLGPAHRREIEELYATGDGGGLAFAPFQLETGMFRGVRNHAGELVAVAGVHVLSRNESVAGVGNVYTRPDCRGHGLAQAVTVAVAAALGEAGIATIGLNVEHTNAPAIQAYERIGFETRFHYFEGVADRVK